MNDIEKRARELLAAEYEKGRFRAYGPEIRNGTAGATWDEEVRAIVAALTPPEGYVLVRQEAIDWLNGEGEFECPPERYFRGQPPRYWWRSVFREKAGLAGSPDVSP